MGKLKKRVFIYAFTHLRIYQITHYQITHYQITHYQITHFQITHLPNFPQGLFQKLPRENRKRAWPCSLKLTTRPVSPSGVGVNTPSETLCAVRQPCDPRSRRPA